MNWDQLEADLLAEGLMIRWANREIWLAISGRCFHLEMGPTAPFAQKHVFGGLVKAEFNSESPGYSSVTGSSGKRSQCPVLGRVVHGESFGRMRRTLPLDRAVHGLHARQRLA